ncbi:MAG: V-type ATPase subunit [Chloroflexi bacterium]|nr:V-type ATPase subunit [Chloroflexota bacterium]
MLRAGEAFLAAYLKGEESKLLTIEHLDMVLKTNKIPDTLAAITDTDIGDYFDSIPASNLQSFEDIDRYLWLYLSKCISNIYWFRMIPAKAKKAAQVFSIRYDVSNIKVALRSIITGKKVQMIPIGFINDNGLISQLAQTEDIVQIIGVLKNAGLERYANLLSVDQESVKDADSLLLLETKLDKQYYHDLLQLTEDKRLVVVYKSIIDLVNLQILFRSIITGNNKDSGVFLIDNGNELKLAMLQELMSQKVRDVPNSLDGTHYKSIAEDIVNSYDKDKSIAVIDQVIDKYKYKLLREALSNKIFSPLIVPWYLTLKELEVRNLRLLLKATLDKVALDRIKVFLVMPS